MTIFTKLFDRLRSRYKPTTKSLLVALEVMEERNEERHRKVMAKLSTLDAQLAEIKANQVEAFGEIRAKIDAQAAKIEELTATLGDTEIPEAAQTLLDALKVGSKELADIVPNAPAPEPQV